MILRFPNRKSHFWTGPFLGNYTGDIWRTFNVDFDNSKGNITLSRSFTSVSDTTDTDMLNLDVVDAFVKTDADCQASRWWALNRNGRLARTDTINPGVLSLAIWHEDNLAATPTDARDMTVGENDSRDTGATLNGRNKLFVTRDSDIAVLNDTGSGTWNNGWWAGTKGMTGLRSGVPHPIEYFPFQRLILFGDGNYIHTIDKSGNCTYARLTLPAYLTIWSIFTTPSRAWILCGGKQGRNGAIVEWDGYSQAYNYVHDAQASNALSGVNNNGVPIVVNSRGLILEYNGSSFAPMVRGGQKICFPSYEELGNLFPVPDISSGTRGIAPRGMTLSDNGLIYINIESPQLPSQRQLAGVWCLDPAIGRLYSKHSLNMGSDTDYGQQYIRAAGAVKAINPDATDTSSSYLLAGGTIHTDYGASFARAIWLLTRGNSSTARRGHFITSYVPSEQIQEIWETIWTEISSFRSTNSKVIIKARGVNPLLDTNRRHLEKIITWTSSTTFTVTLSSGDDHLAVGDEIEVISGKNSGVLAHITVIAGNHAALQTITIDETVTGTSGTSLCRFDRWKKLGIITDASKFTIPLNIGIISSFIQFKIELRGPILDYDIKSLSATSIVQMSLKK